jgi:hypothetical protein
MKSEINGFLEGILTATRFQGNTLIELQAGGAVPSV